MLRIVLHTVPRVGRSYEHFLDGFELHLLRIQPASTHARGRTGLRLVLDAADTSFPGGFGVFLDQDCERLHGWQRPLAPASVGKRVQSGGPSLYGYFAHKKTCPPRTIVGP